MADSRRNIVVRAYADPTTFLSRTREVLEANEAANSLMLGICERLARHPERFEAEPCLRTVEDQDDLVIAALMTPPHNLVLHSRQSDFMDAARVLVEGLLEDGWELPGVIGPVPVVEAVVQGWEGVTGGNSRLEHHLRAYEVRQVMVPAPDRGRLRLATEADLPLVAGWRYDFEVAIHGDADEAATRRSTQARVKDGDVYLWVEDRPVSLASKTRATSEGISIGQVYTPPEFRQRGYATACVGELSRMLLNSGWNYCALFADLANPTANHIYQRVGYRPVCDYDAIVFDAVRP
jgi:predicted GNAT family acetyltransferase